MVFLFEVNNLSLKIYMIFDVFLHSQVLKGLLEKYVRSKLSTFDPSPPLFVPVRFKFIPPPPPPQRTFALVSPPPLSSSQKQSRDAYEFSNENQGVKRENNFCKLNIKDQCFLHSYTSFNCQPLFMKKTQLYMLDQAQNRKTFSNSQATYQKELCLLCEKSGNFFQINVQVELIPLSLFVFVRFLRNPLTAALCHQREVTSFFS